MNAALSSPTITPGAIVVGDRMSPGVAGRNVNSIYIEVGDDNARIRRNVLDENRARGNFSHPVGAVY